MAATNKKPTRNPPSGAGTGKKTRANKNKASTKKAAPADLATAEKDLKKKYPNVVTGTLKESGAVPDFGNKRTVEIKCAKCPNTRRIATSDLHQVKHCTDCIATVRLERRKKTRGTTKKTNTGKTQKTVRTAKNGTKKPTKPRTPTPPPIPTTEPTTATT